MGDVPEMLSPPERVAAIGIMAMVVTATIGDVMKTPVIRQFKPLEISGWRGSAQTRPSGEKLRCARHAIMGPHS